MKQERIWRYFQGEGSQSFGGAQGRIRALFKRVGPGERVLNIGLGSGLFERMCVKSSVDIHAMDPDGAAIGALSRELSLEGKCKQGFSQHIPWPDLTFDVVVMSEVMEHLDVEALSKSVREVRRVLKCGGRFIGTVPAQERLEESLVVCPECGKRFHRWGHVQSFDRERLEGLLRGSFDRWRIKKKVFVTWSVLNWKGKITAAIRSALCSCGVHGAGENFYFEAVRECE